MLKVEKRRADDYMFSLEEEMRIFNPPRSGQEVIKQMVTYDELFEDKQ